MDDWLLLTPSCQLAEEHTQMPQKQTSLSDWTNLFCHQCDILSNTTTGVSISPPHIKIHLFTDASIQEREPCIQGEESFACHILSDMLYLYVISCRLGMLHFGLLPVEVKVCPLLCYLVSPCDSGGVKCITLWLQELSSRQRAYLVWMLRSSCTLGRLLFYTDALYMDFLALAFLMCDFGHSVSRCVTSTITPAHVQAKNKKGFLGVQKCIQLEKPREKLKKNKSDISQDTPSLLKVSQFKSNNQPSASEMTPIIEQSLIMEEEAPPFLTDNKDTSSVLISDDIISHVNINNKRRYSSRVEGKQKSGEFLEEIHNSSGDGDSLDLLLAGLGEETIASYRQLHPSVLLERISNDTFTDSNVGEILPNTIKSNHGIEKQEFNKNIDLSLTPKLPKLHSKIPIVKSSKTESVKKLNLVQNCPEVYTVSIPQQSKKKETCLVNSFDENSRRATFVVQRLKEDSKFETDTKSIEKVALSQSQQENGSILSSKVFSVIEPNQDIQKPELQCNHSDNSKKVDSYLSGSSDCVGDIGTCGQKEPLVKSSSEEKRLLLSPTVSQRLCDKPKPVHNPSSQEEDVTCILPEDMELTCTLDALVGGQSRSLITTDLVDGIHHSQGSSVETNHSSQVRKLAEKVELSGEKPINSVATLEHEQTFSEDDDDDPEYIPSTKKPKSRKDKEKTSGNLHGKNRKGKKIPNFRFFSNKGSYMSGKSKTKRADNQTGEKAVEPTQTDKLHFSVYDLSLNESNTHPNAVRPNIEQVKIRLVTDKKNAEDELVDNGKRSVKKRKNQGSGVPQKKPCLDLEEVCLEHGNLTKTNDCVVENSQSKMSECKKKQRKICINKCTSKENHNIEGISQAKDKKKTDNIQNSPKDSQVLFSAKLEDTFSSSPQEKKNDLVEEDMEQCKENTSESRSVVCKQKTDKQKTKKPSMRHKKLSKPQTLFEMPHNDQDDSLSTKRTSLSTGKLKPFFDDPFKKDADHLGDKENKETVFIVNKYTETAVEEMKQSEDQSCPRQRRTVSRVSYKELPLNKKLRQGDACSLNVCSDVSPTFSGKESRGTKKKNKTKSSYRNSSDLVSREELCMKMENILNTEENSITSMPSS
ncbi:uncharacterized protein LOC143235716 [Tachypleus tridentatus]|uniref:uncharacterized protein LOC143235716 n=1 Tax=Tachypleus tridentatus TaxID=6853 RepID=UPI003FD075E2